MGGFLPVPGQSIYGASKAAVKLLTEGLHLELLTTNVRVTVIFPGAIGTNIAANSGVAIGQSSGNEAQRKSITAGAQQSGRDHHPNLVITPHNESPIQVDNLEVAQFIYLLLHNEKIRDVVDTVGKKAVLILGRFTTERKVVLETLREALSDQGYLPILFDFEKPSNRDTHETIVTLAGMARFIIADITDPKSIPQELGSIVPNLPSVPVQPVLQAGYEPRGMYDHISQYPWVLPLFQYESETKLVTELKQNVIDPAEERAKQQRPR